MGKPQRRLMKCPQSTGLAVNMVSKPEAKNITRREKRKKTQNIFHGIVFTRFRLNIFVVLSFFG